MKSPISSLVSVWGKIKPRWGKCRRDMATLKDLLEMEQRIMSAISTFAEKQAAFNERIDAAVVGLKGDVDALNAKIEELQNSAGTITPEDQALLDALEARGDAIAAKVEALDAMTPPVVPPVPPV